MEGKSKYKIRLYGTETQNYAHIKREILARPCANVYMCVCEHGDGKAVCLC